MSDIGNPVDDLSSVYAYVVDQLAACGVTTAFGLMGEDTAALIADLDRQKIRYHPARHENVAVAMADGYAWATGNVGVAIISRGPGLTNALTAAATAAKGGHRVLTISAESSHGRPNDLKRVDQRAMAESVSLAYFRVDAADNVLERFEAAWSSAATGTACVLAVPQDILWGDCPPRRPADPAGAELHAVGAHEADLSSAIELLERSERPLILVGRGGLAEREVYERLADRVGGLLATTLLAKDLFAGSPFDVGVLGGFSDFSARPIVRTVDCVLAFGASLTGFTRGHGKLIPQASIIQFDVNPSAFGRYGPVDVAVVGDAPTCAHRLLEVVRGRETGPLRDPQVLETLADRDVFGPEDESGPNGIDPRVLTVALDGILPERRLVVTDGGHHMGFGVSALRVGEPGGAFLSSGEFAALGIGLGAACGAAIGRPDMTTVLFIGDGGLAMTLGDLQTVVRERRSIVIIVMNDRAYGAEVQVLDVEGLPRQYAQFEDVDFAAIGRALGIPSFTVRCLDDLEAHYSDLAEPRTPLLFDCKVNPEVRAQWMLDRYSPGGDRATPHLKR